MVIITRFLRNYVIQPMGCIVILINTYRPTNRPFMAIFWIKGIKVFVSRLLYLS